MGIEVDNSFRFRNQCLEARNKAYRILGFINKNVLYKSKEVIKSLYNSYVRPHLEYCIQVWKPHIKQDILLLESIQRRATKLIPSLRNKPYEDRLKELGMYTLEYRLLRGDLIEMFKIFSGRDRIDINRFFKLRENSGNRGHKWTISKPRCNTDLRKYFFSHRVVNSWNNLPDVVIESTSLNNFKNNLDKHLLGDNN